jgi:hypothetical protein
MNSYIKLSASLKLPLGSPFLIDWPGENLQNMNQIGRFRGWMCSHIWTATIFTLSTLMWMEVDTNASSIPKMGFPFPLPNFKIHWTTDEHWPTIHPQSEGNWVLNIFHLHRHKFPHPTSISVPDKAGGASNISDTCLCTAPFMGLFYSASNIPFATYPIKNPKHSQFCQRIGHCTIPCRRHLGRTFLVDLQHSSLSAGSGDLEHGSSKEILGWFDMRKSPKTKIQKFGVDQKFCGEFTDFCDDHAAQVMI